MAGRRKRDSFFAVVFLIVCFSRTISAVDLYPYGTTNGDLTLSRTNDVADPLPLGDWDFPYGEKYYNHLFIGDNGVISFDEEVFVEEDNPVFRNIPIFYDVDDDGRSDEFPNAILPFWADVDISGTDDGSVFYRRTEASAITAQATADVREYFPSNPNFGAQEVVIVTWDRVSFYAQVGGTDPRNLFQAVLITDGKESFVLFLYDEISWTVGTRMGGDPDLGTGVGEGHALIGFTSSPEYELAGISKNQAQLLTLPANTNVGKAGVFAFKVDGGTVIDPACAPSKELSITPTRCGMMGGEKIYLYGPCWDAQKVWTCIFSYNDLEIQRVNATVESNDVAHCVPDPFFLVGEVDIAVLEHGADSATAKTSTYSLIESGRITPTVTRSSMSSSNWETTGNSLEVTWDTDSESFSGNMLTISVLAYREDGSLGPRWDTVYVITNDTTDTGSFRFSPTAQAGVTSANAFGVIQITSNSETRQRVLWSDIHALGYLLEQDYQDEPMQWASEKCDEWIIDDDNKELFTEGLPACPCTLEQAAQDVGTFITDPSCYPNGGSNNCNKHEGATHCYLSAYASSPTNAGTKCCYDDNEMLMYAGDTMYAGMSGRSHIRGASPYLQRNLVPELSHWTNDLIARQVCCGWAGEKGCYEYRKRRPTSDCEGYNPPNIALSFGDPHFITFDGFNYTFNGLGEYTLIRFASSRTGDFDFELQGRQVRSKDVDGNSIYVTQLSAVAMQDSNSDTIFIAASVSSGMDIYRRSTGGQFSSLYFSTQTFIDLQGCAVGVTEFQRTVEIYGAVAMFKETGMGVQVTYNNGMLAVRPIIPSDKDSDRLFGLLGNMNGDPDDDLMNRDTNAEVTDPTDENVLAFGKSWEIETDYELFYYPGMNNAEGHAIYHNDSFEPMLNVDLPTLYPACEDCDQCLFDYKVSGEDEELAMATLGTYNAFRASLEDIKKIDACRFISTPFNGTKDYSSSNSYFEGAQMTFACSDGLIMVGSSHRICEYNDTGTLVWTGSDVDNACIDSECGPLTSPVNGSITLSENLLTATFQCDVGFNLNGAIESVCADGTWSNSPPSCSTGGGPNVVGLAVGLTFAFIVIILAAVLGFLYYRKNKKSPKSKSKPKTTDARDAELSEPLNKKPQTDVRASTRSSSSNKSNEGNTGPSAQIYKPTPMAQASVKYNASSSSNKKPTSKPPEPVKKDPTLASQTKPVEPELNLAVSTVDERVPLPHMAKTEKSAPPSVAAKPKTPDTLRKEPANRDNGSYSSAAPSVTYKTPSRDEADDVKGTGLLQNTNITGTGGWI